MDKNTFQIIAACKSLEPHAALMQYYNNTYLHTDKENVMKAAMVTALTNIIDEYKLVSLTRFVNMLHEDARSYQFWHNKEHLDVVDNLFNNAVSVIRLAEISKFTGYEKGCV